MNASPAVTARSWRTIAAAVSLAVWCMAGQPLARLLRTDAQWRALSVILGGLLVAPIIPMWL